MPGVPRVKAQLPPATVDLTAVSGTPPAQQFSASLTLPVPLNGAAGVVVLAGQTVLRGTFQPLVANALAAGSPSPAQVSGGGDALVVQLPRPVEIRRVTLAASAARLALHRVDGARLAGDSAVEPANGADLPGPPSQFVATRFGVRAKDGSNNQLTSLAGSSLVDLQVLSRPASPQLLVRDPSTDPASAPRWLPVFGSAGEIGAGAPTSAGAVDAGPALAAALAGTARLPGAALQLEFLLQSSAPCRFALTQLIVAYRLLSTTFGGSPSGRESLTLRLAAGGSPEPVPLGLPAGASVRIARLAATETFAPDRALPDPAGGTADPPPGLGIRLGTGDSTAALVDPGARAGLVSGVAVRVLPMAMPAVASLQVRADDNGAPAGRPLASGDLPLPATGTASWVQITDPALTGVSGPYWLVLSARAGPVLWVVEPDGGDVPPVLLLGSGQPGGTASGPPGVRVATRFVARPAVPAASTESGLGLPPYQVTSPGGSVTLPAADAHGVRLLDLTSLLAPGADAEPVRVVPLARGLLTLDALHVEYE